MRQLELSALLVAASAAAAALGGCSSSDDEVIVIPSGKVASDFQTIADYLAEPVVQRIFLHMPRHVGSDAPDMEGTYTSSGEVTASNVTPRGTPVSADFCFGLATASRLNVRVLDPSVEEAGARSFIEGSFDSFTVYTAFKSVQVDSGGATCEIHQVNVFSGTRNADGSISDLYIAWGVVGVLGPCAGSVLAGDYQVSLHIGERTGESCTGGELPGDPDLVTVDLENFLLAEVMVFFNDEVAPTIILPGLSYDSVEVDPNFELYFETLQPSAGPDPAGGEFLMGEIMAGLFPVDITPAGSRTGPYQFINEVGVDIYFAPLPLIQSAFELFAVTNVGIPLPEYPPPPGNGLDCFCSMIRDANEYFIGYYSYFFEQSNVYFYRIDNETVPYLIFDGPFPLTDGEGSVVLLVDDG